MNYRILGPLEVIDDEEPIDVGSPQQRELLALLLLNANHVVPTEHILDELWHDEASGKESTLWVYVSRLRSILEPGRRARSDNSVLVTSGRGYMLVTDDDEIDARRFETFAADGNRLLVHHPDEAMRVLGDALDLWRGAALEDFPYAEFARPEAARLEELRLVAIEDRIDAGLRTMHHWGAIGELEKLVLDHPLRERLIALQMTALYRVGRQCDALRGFERYRRAIADDLGIVPSPEIRHIQEQVLLHDPELAPTTASITVVDTPLGVGAVRTQRPSLSPRHAPLRVRPHALPDGSSSIDVVIERLDELFALVRLLADVASEDGGLPIVATITSPTDRAPGPRAQEIDIDTSNTVSPPRHAETSNVAVAALPELLGAIVQSP